jgi:N,N-dimethylformamidase
MWVTPERSEAKRRRYPHAHRLRPRKPHAVSGLSTYDRHLDGSGVAFASPHRPLQNFRPTGRHWNFNLDLFIIDWLEHLGGDYHVVTEEDLHREGLDLRRSTR